MRLSISVLALCALFLSVPVLAADAPDAGVAVVAPVAVAPAVDAPAVPAAEAVTPAVAVTGTDAEEAGAIATVEHGVWLLLAGLVALFLVWLKKKKATP